MPAGDMEKLNTALLFGADAVYLGGKEFSLRAFAGNLTLEEIKLGLELAHGAGKRIYVTVNILAHNRDLKELPGYLEALQQMGADGLIIADLGVLRLARIHAPDLPVTVSTQANTTNYEAAAQYRDLGAKRLVLARELDLEEIRQIKERVDVEIEVFIHGAMCVSYSGRCLLSHFMTGRSANQGACAHPCRYRYYLTEEKRPGQYFPLEEDSRGSYIFNSRDLCLLEMVPQMIDAGIDAFKVEGRMKSPLYAATAARVYRQAIDWYVSNRHPYPEDMIQAWGQELQSIATRPYTTGFIGGGQQLLQDPRKESIAGRADFCGITTGFDPELKIVEVEQRANFGIGEQLQFLLPDGSIVDLTLTDLWDAEGLTLDRARHPQQRVFMAVRDVIPVNSILRRRNWPGER
ncbi:MAG: U32 family peptidase [Syntrophomonadaceae bacterium]